MFSNSWFEGLKVWSKLTLVKVYYWLAIKYCQSIVIMHHHSQVSKVPDSKDLTEQGAEIFRVSTAIFLPGFVPRNFILFLWFDQSWWIYTNSSFTYGLVQAYTSLVAINIRKLAFIPYLINCTIIQISMREEQGTQTTEGTGIPIGSQGHILLNSGQAGWLFCLKNIINKTSRYCMCHIQPATCTRGNDFWL